jgi:hypothetical protein
MAEVHRVLLPVNLPEATFWEIWDAVNYLAERLPARLRLERALSSELQAFISTDDAERLHLQGERLIWLHRGEIRGEAAPGDATQGPPHDWEAGECQPRTPQQGRDAGPPGYMDEQPGQNEEESASWKEVETAQRTAG